MGNKYFPPRGTRTASNNAAITRKQRRKIPLTGSKEITESPQPAPPLPPPSHFPPPAAAHPFVQEKSKVRGNRKPVLFLPPPSPPPEDPRLLAYIPTHSQDAPGRVQRPGFVTVIVSSSALPGSVRAAAVATSVAPKQAWLRAWKGSGEGGDRKGNCRGTCRWRGALSNRCLVLLKKEKGRKMCSSATPAKTERTDARTPPSPCSSPSVPLQNFLFAGAARRLRTPESTMTAEVA